MGNFQQLRIEVPWHPLSPPVQKSFSSADWSVHNAMYSPTVYLSTVHLSLCHFSSYAYPPPTPPFCCLLGSLFDYMLLFGWTVIRILCLSSFSILEDFTADSVYWLDWTVVVSVCVIDWNWGECFCTVWVCSMSVTNWSKFVICYVFWTVNIVILYCVCFCYNEFVVCLCCCSV